MKTLQKTLFGNAHSMDIETVLETMKIQVKEEKDKHAEIVFIDKPKREAKEFRD